MTIEHTATAEQTEVDLATIVTGRLLEVNITPGTMPDSIKPTVTFKATTAAETKDLIDKMLIEVLQPLIGKVTVAELLSYPMKQQITAELLLQLKLVTKG